MKYLPPNKALRWSLKALLGVVRRIQILADGPMPELQPLRVRLSAVYAELCAELNAAEAKR